MEILLVAGTFIILQTMAKRLQYCCSSASKKLNFSRLKSQSLVRLDKVNQNLFKTKSGREINPEPLIVFHK
ncbi:hypothetical protein ASG14_00895 [Pedobacter sp. Leaf194]|nr:hypothetical protein ASG14_00895 [Pedobacter sp. Leaf194]